jgi:aminopeptidase N
MNRTPWSRAVAAASAVAAVVILASCSPGDGHQGGTASQAPGIGDSYYPDLGNPGYDAEHYILDLAVDPVRGSLSGTAVIRARATRTLSRFSFDLTGLNVAAVTVDGAPAVSSRQHDKLIIIPPRALAAGAGFSVAVTYQGIPQPIPDASGNSTGASRVGWHHDGDEVYVASEPAGARTWYPVNDTPRDKATYTFDITVPAGYTAVANGLPQGERSHAGATTFTWQCRSPMASYLATIGIARFTRLAATGPGGLPILTYAPAALAAQTQRTFAGLPAMIRYFETILGPYPFDSAGAIVVSPAFRWSLETQTRPVYGSQILTLEPDVAQEGISHELAHQWFGDSVSLTNWSDIWLNEGFATYLSWLWLEHLGDRGFLTGLMRTEYGYVINAPDYAALLQHPDMPPAQILTILHRQFQPDGHPVPDAQIPAAMGLASASQLTARKALGLLGGVKPGSADAVGYLQDARSSAPASPPGTDLFATAVYNRGAMTLQALRLRVGDPVFFRILRSYAAGHRFGNTTTAGFIADAEKVSGQDLRAFFRTWLYAPAAPPMPPLLPTQ